MGAPATAKEYNFSMALSRTVDKYESLSAGKKADFERSVSKRTVEVDEKRSQAHKKSKLE
jgi:hypothetical protein